MLKRNDPSRPRVIEMIIDFLLEESIQIEKPDLKVEIFLNVCRFQREWIITAETYILPEKMFECFLKCFSLYSEISSNLYIQMLDMILRPINAGVTNSICLIDGVNYISDQERKRNTIMVIMQNILQLLEDEFEGDISEQSRSIKPMIIKLFACVSVQSDTIWSKCLKFEDEYNSISDIKEYLLSNKQPPGPPGPFHQDLHRPHGKALLPQLANRLSPKNEELALFGLRRLGVGPEQHVRDLVPRNEDI